MSVTLGTNISALRATNLLNKSSLALADTYERLSSGSRINRAADDPAGLAVSLGLSNRARVLGRASQNIQDGLSTITIADSALEQSSNTLGRMAELAAQAANGSLSRAQRLTIFKEFVSLSNEIRRIGDTTTFNGVNLLRGNTSNNQGTIIQAVDSGADYTAQKASANGRYVLQNSTDNATSNTYSIYDSVNKTTTQLVDDGGTLLASAAMDAQGNVVYSDGTNLYRYDITTGSSTRLTNSTVSSSAFSQLTISADGSRIAFRSTRQFSDNSSIGAQVSTSGTQYLYSVDLTTNSVRRVVADSGAGALNLSSDGTKLAFLSKANINSGNADGNLEIFAVDLAAASFTIRQITNTTSSTAYLGPSFSNSGLAQIYNDGSVIFFDNRNYSNLNSSGKGQLFRVDSTGTTSLLSTLNLNAAPAILQLSADESAVYFDSNSNPTGDSPNSAVQAYKIDFATGLLSRISNFTNISQGSLIGGGAFSGDGRLFFGNQQNIATSGYSIFDLTQTATQMNFAVGATGNDYISTTFGSLVACFDGIGGYTLTSAASARSALDAVQSTISKIATLRGVFGANGARLDIASNVTSALSLGVTSANNRIRDADIAAESASLTRTQILQRVGTAVLAQANQQPAVVYQLLAAAESTSRR